MIYSTIINGPFGSFGTVLSAVLASYTIIGAGFAFRRSGWITKDAHTRFLFITVNLFMPCFIFSRIVLSGAKFETRDMLLPPLFGAASIALGIAFARLAVMFLPESCTGLKNLEEKNTFAAVVGNLNYGFVPIPLVYALFPKDETLLGVLLMQNLGIEFCIWTLTIFVIIGHRQKGLWKRAINGPTFAILVSAALSFSINSGGIPEGVLARLEYLKFAKISIEYLGQIAIPLSMFLVGCTMSDFHDFTRIRQKPWTSLKIAFWGSILRIGILPGIMIFTAVCLPDSIVSLEMRKVIIIHGGMASAVFPIVLCEIYGGEPTVALDVIISNSFLSLLTTPIWISLGLGLLG